MSDSENPNQANETPPESNSDQETSGNEIFNFNEALASFLKYLKEPKTLLDTIMAMVKGSSEFFAEGKDRDLNHALGFYLCTVVYGLAFGLVGMLFQLNIVGVFFAIPMGLFGAVIALAITSLVVWLIVKFIGKGEDNFLEVAKLVMMLSWTGLIAKFPLFVFLPLFLQGLLTIAGLALFAYLLIPAATERFKTKETTHGVVIWAVTGVFALFILGGSLIGTGANYAVNSAEDAAERALEQAAEMEKEYLEKLEKEREAANKEAAALQAQQAAELAKQNEAASPDKQVKNILKQLRDLGEAEVPRELKQAFRKLGDHTKGADFSKIKVKGLDLRMIDLTDADFRGANIDGWTFHGIGNTPSSILDGADFRGATFNNVNMAGVSAKGADFSGATLVGVERFKMVVNLQKADLEGADFSEIKFSGNRDAKAFNLGQAKLEGATFEDSVLPNSAFNKARLRGVNFEGADLTGVVLNGADIREAVFKKADLTGMQIAAQWKLGTQYKPFDHDMSMTDGADFSGAKLNNVNFNFRNFRFCNFSDASLVNADLEGGNFVGSNFEGADLTNAKLMRANFAAADLSGAKFHNNNWEHAHTAGAKLSGVKKGNPILLPNLPEGSSKPRLKSGKKSDLTEGMVNGTKTSWGGADLRKVSFERLRIDNIDFTGANLAGAVFNYAQLGRCNFSLANLEGASFAFARLFQCNFNEAKLASASFHGAALADNSFVKADLPKADFSYTGRSNWGTSSKLNFEGANLAGATFENARLSYISPSRLAQARASTSAQHIKDIGLGGNSAYIDFDDADLTGANLKGALLDEVSFARANLTDVDAKNSNVGGFYATWDTIWKGSDFSESNMAWGQIWHVGAKTEDGRSDFASAKIRGANLFRFSATPGTWLGPVDFTDCVFGANPWGTTGDVYQYGGTSLNMLNLEGAKFVGADLRNSGFVNSNLVGADFSRADLSSSYFGVGNATQAGFGLENNLKDWAERYKNIKFQRANLEEAELTSGDFTGGDFSGAKTNGIAIHRPSDGLPYQPMSYVYGVPENL